MSTPPKTRTQTLRIAAALALTLSAGATHAGLVFTQEIKGEGEAAQFQNMTMHTSIDTGGAKMEIVSSGSPLLAAGSYLLVQPDDDAMLLVNPKEKTYASFDIGAMLGAAGQMMGGMGAEGGIKMSFSDPIVEKLLEEDGGTLLGRATKHYRWRTRYTMTMAMPMGMSMAMATDQTQDVWVADIAIDPKILRSFSNMGAGASLPADFQKIVETAKAQQKGFPLKMVTTSSTKSTGTGAMAAMMARASDGEKPQTSTMIVTELKEESVPASVFAIPAGYRETELMSPGMKMPDMNRQN
jgi:hypothetical protein